MEEEKADELADKDERYENVVVDSDSNELHVKLESFSRAGFLSIPCGNW